VSTEPLGTQSLAANQFPLGASPVSARPRTRRPGVFWFATLACLLVFAGATLYAVVDYLSSSGPAGAVHDYFAALQQGDAADALAFGAVPAGPHSYLSAQVLREQLSVAGISGIDTMVSQRQGDRVSVRVSYVLSFASGPQQVQDSVDVLHVHGRWQLERSAIRTVVSLSQAGNRASLAGSGLPVTQVVLFPGALPLSFDTPDLEVDPASTVVRLSGANLSNLPVRVSASGRQLVGTAVDTAVRGCLDYLPPDALCPVPSDPASHTRAVPGSLRGTLVPGSLSSDPGVAAGADGQLHIAGSFRVEGSYQSLDFNNQITEKSGTITVDFGAHCYATSPRAIGWDTP
jgi:hypothetical protein